MAEDSDLEKTEPASPRRLEEARKKGNIPRSRELNTFAILIVAGATLLMMGAQLTAGMTDLLRPSHYNAYHRMEAVESIDGRSRVDVVGPVCESGDFLALDRDIEDLRAGDLLAVHSAGAYGYVMASNYNTRGKPAEVLVDGERFALVTARESYEHLVSTELLEPEWRVD